MSFISRYKSRYNSEGAIDSEVQGRVFSFLTATGVGLLGRCGTETLVLAVIGVGSLEQSRKRSVYTPVMLAFSMDRESWGAIAAVHVIFNLV